MAKFLGNDMIKLLAHLFTFSFQQRDLFSAPSFYRRFPNTYTAAFSSFTRSAVLGGTIVAVQYNHTIA